MFTIRLHSFPKLNDTQKYRNGSIIRNNIPLFTDSNVNNGNFNNFEILNNNEVEINTGGNNSMALCAKATHISITPDFDNALWIVGQIIAVQYTNDGNARIAYNIDAFSTARASNLVSDMQGLCERTHLNYTVSPCLVNLLPEPFTPSDTIRAFEFLTGNINEVVRNFEGVTPTGSALTDENTRCILTVSPAIVEYLGIQHAFQEPPTNFTQELKSINNFKFNASDVTYHSGGVFRGTPLMFKYPAQVKSFITNILGGCGFRTILPPEGYKSDGNIRWQYLTPETAGGGNAFIGGVLNESYYELESLRFITTDDIYNFYVIPSNFCQPIARVIDSQTNIVEGLHDLTSFHGFGAENNQKSKLLTYPYLYYKAVTANGDTVNLYPQVYADREGVWQYKKNLILDMKFIGGDKPRLMGRFKPALSPYDNYDNTSLSEWFTIRNYPCVGLSINDSFSPQRQREINQNRNLSALNITTHNQNAFSNPFKAGFRDGINTGQGQMSTHSGWDTIKSMAGIALNATLGDTTAKSMTKDVVGQTMANAQVNAQAGAQISPQASYFEGNDYMTQYGIPAFAMYGAGASNAEEFTYSRYIDNYGVACNCTLNPLNNSGVIFGGLGFVEPFEGRTFYKFLNITVNGNFCGNWKADIKQLFEGGVYLLEN